MRTYYLHRFLQLAFVAVSLSLWVRPANAQITYYDGTFNNSDWEITTLQFGNGGKTLATQVVANNGLDTYRRVTDQVFFSFIPGSLPYAWVLGFHRRVGAVYDPSQQGPITSINYSEDSILFSTVSYGQGQATGLALRQNGKVYIIGSSLTPEYIWTHKAVSNLKAVNFSLVDTTTKNIKDTSQHPDFSVTGGPIEFGFFRVNSTGSNTGYTMIGGIDNWTVTIKPSKTLKGKILLQDSTNLSQSVFFKFQQQTTNFDFTIPVTLKTDGSYSLSIPVGIFDIAIKGDKWLQKMVTVDTTHGSVSNVNVTLPAGDANNDNVVDFDDLTILATAYGAMAGDPFYDDRADFNNDGVVDFEDLTLLAINYGLNGDG